MRRKAIRFLLTLVLVCTGATVVSAGDNLTPRPFMGSMSGEAVADYDSGACLDLTGAPHETISHMAGTLTHLGWAEYHSSHCLNPLTFGLEYGEATLVAANGDEIWLSYSADLISPFTPPPVVLVYAVDNVVVGGTGRFENASGEFLSLVFITVEDLAALSVPVGQEFTGNITF